MAFLRQTLLSLVFVTLVFHTTTNDTKKRVSRAFGTNRALLKPLTPIADSNLFLNTPYKMLDRTRPSCYATWFNEHYHEWPEKQWPTVTMVCNKKDQEFYNTPDADWVFERNNLPESIATYHGTVKIRNLGSGKTLETWKSSDVWWVGLGDYENKPDEDMWNVQSDPRNKNNLQLEIQNWWLHLRPSANHRSYIVLKRADEAGYPYAFVPAIELVAKMYNFVFSQPANGEIARHSSKKDLLDSYDVNNVSPATITRTINVSERVTNEFSWGFSESLKLFSKVTGSAGIPFLAEGKVEAGFELTGTANQSWRNSVEKLFSMAYVVNVPARTRVTISAWYELINGISMDYTASTEITGKATRITVFDDLVSDSPATGEMIRKHLEYSRFDGTIVDIKAYSVIAQIKGKMVASVGVKGQLNVNGRAVATEAVPK